MDTGLRRLTPPPPHARRAPLAVTTCAPSVPHATAGSTSPSGACSACASPIFVESASPPGTACAALGALFCPARAPRGSTRDPRGAGGPSGPWGNTRTCSACASWPGKERSRDLNLPSPFISPLEHPNSTRSRAGAPAPGGVVPSERQWVTQRPRRDVERAPQAAGAPPVARLPQQARASGPWVVQQLEAHVQPGQLVRALGGGPPPHAMAQHNRPVPPRTAQPTRRGRRRSQAVRLSWPCGEAGGRARPAGFGQGVSRALGTPRPLGCVPGPSHAPALALAAASRICTSACAPNPMTLTLTLTLTPNLTDAFRAVIALLVLVLVLVP